MNELRETGLHNTINVFTHSVDISSMHTGIQKSKHSPCRVCLKIEKISRTLSFKFLGATAQLPHLNEAWSKYMEMCIFLKKHSVITFCMYSCIHTQNKDRNSCLMTHGVKIN